MSELGTRSNAGRLLRRGSLHFVDRHHVAWQVTERDARYDPGSHGDWCLVFASDNAIRRVWSYPSTWRTMSDLELEALSWSPFGALRLLSGPG